MNRSQTNRSHAHTVRVDAFIGQMHATERAKVAQAIERFDMAEIERAAIARRIKQARKEAGLSQPEMAEALGVIPRTYQNYESVKEPRTPWGLMNDLARITGKSAQWLLHGDRVTPEPFSADQDLAGQLEQIDRKLDLIMLALEINVQAEPAAGPVPDRLPEVARRPAAGRKQAT